MTSQGASQPKYLRKKPKSKKHLNKPSKQCEICDEKLNSMLYMFQARGCANCGKSGCKQCVNYSRTFSNSQTASVCKNCKDLPRKMKNTTFVNKEDEKLDQGDEKFESDEKKQEGDDEKLDENDNNTHERHPMVVMEKIPEEDAIQLEEEGTALKIDGLDSEVSRLEQQKLRDQKAMENAKRQEKLALSRFREISAENTKLKGELSRAKNLTRGGSFDDSQVLIRLDEIQHISEGRDEELIKVGKQMDDLVHQLQVTETQKNKAVMELQEVQTNQIEQLEQIVGRLSTQKGRTLEIKHKLQSAIDERDYHKNLAATKEREINELMAENDKLREILDESESSSSSASTFKTASPVSTPEQVPIKIIVDVFEKQAPKTENVTASKHAEVQTVLPGSDGNKMDGINDEEEWEIERRKMQGAMDNLRYIIRKWKDSGLVEVDEGVVLG